MDTTILPLNCNGPANGTEKLCREMATSIHNCSVSTCAVTEPPDETLQNVRFVFQQLLVPIVALVGIMFNSLTMIIMTRRRMRSSTNNYLAALATADCLYLICTIYFSLRHRFGETDPRYNFYRRMRPLMQLLVDTAQNTSVWLTVTFTIERYIAVCHPMRGKVLCTESRSRKVILAVLLYTIVLTLPTFFEFKIVEERDSRNETIAQVIQSEMGANVLFTTVYYWLLVVMNTVVPLVILIVFNTFLVRSVHISRRQRSTMTLRQRPNSAREPSSQENKITVMLIAVVILFLVCQMPSAALLIYTTFDDARTTFILVLGNFFNFLVCVNASGNFVLYCLLSNKYRKTFINMFCPCLQARFNPLLHSIYGQYQNSTTDESPGINRKHSCASVGGRGPKGPLGDGATSHMLSVPATAGAGRLSANPGAGEHQPSIDPLSLNNNLLTRNGRMTRASSLPENHSLWSRFRFGSRFRNELPAHQVTKSLKDDHKFNNGTTATAVPCTRECVVIVTSDYNLKDQLNDVNQKDSSPDI
ncbi:FMRFamide receptor-like [Varroa jacobsoni]|uniref:G-protein coupled receptors family 1 profile domain-containing protein n=1 Tax=Varroa destructor TaxID=109461 RepID=A0A7M7K8J6_VARDE|nr:FMRFamide receptor-like [Varroa destructor]XP_022663223.1 FMRFamide receptor-like [Varroa destructor]XP_022663224.1 FMRFamide receptor-like [Varroa destructor]XP_022707176.1 FMRFamide receptor-like [Varroa jacobsoni]